MNNEQIARVQQGFQEILPIKDQAADLFYNRLFELDPSLRPMFKSDMGEQKKALMSVLALAVSKLNQLHEIMPAVEKLGRNHESYGVKAEHYDTVGQALIDTLRTAFAERWTDADENAWTAVYGTLASAMQQSGSANATGS